MKIAIIGSRNLTIDNLQDYLPENTTGIVSGGAKGVDACAKKYAEENEIEYVEFLPNYKMYKRGAPLKRNLEIIAYADTVIAFWDGQSSGTRYVILECEKRGIPCHVVEI